MNIFAIVIITMIFLCFIELFIILGCIMIETLEDTFKISNKIKKLKIKKNEV